MYNKKASKEFGMETTVGDVLSKLIELPTDMKVCFNGSVDGYLHVDTSENLCSFDSETDSDWYEDTPL